MPKTNLQDCLISVIDNRGVTPHKRGTEWSDSGIPVYSANNVKTSGLQKIEDIRFVPEEVYSTWMKQPLEKGDILLTSEAPAGEVYYWDSDEKIIVGQRLYGLKVKKDINSKYLKYYLQSSIGQKAIQSQQSGSTVFGISAKTFPNIVVNLPDRKKQDKIAELLYSIDKKIDINNRINSELESMAKTIYDYWFLQFEFPNEEGKPYKSSGGKMVWNDELKREIPEGWEVKGISEIASLYQPKTISGDEILQNGKYLVYGANGIVGTYNEYNHENNEIAICCRGASCGDYLMTLPKSWITGNAMVVGISDAKLKEFVFYGLSKEGIAPFISGSAQPQITRTNLENMKLIIPAYKLIDKFGKMSVSYRKQIENNAFQCKELTSLRDFLLPMLMNGQVTFKEKE